MASALKLAACNRPAARLEPATSTTQHQPSIERRLQFPWRIPDRTPSPLPQRRRQLLLILAATSFASAVGDFQPLNSLERARAEEKSSEEKDEGLLGGVLSLFDPYEKSKSGKILPKSYLKSAREVVKNLRESLKEDVKDAAKFRRSADSAKESIKEFMKNWTGQKSVASEDSYTALVSAIRVLAGFYSKKGPTAALPEDIKSKVMDDLNSAEAAL
uniref:Photosystem II D1 processing protein PSB27-H2, chloroplastic n=1 Tax=Araucaria cunninghamii TaxID=56994 RepID=A0A0D6R3T5_ARACU